MIGRCPSCGIELKEPPFNNRETNEVLITMIYRGFMDKGISIKPVDEIGYCEICKAKKEDLEQQKALKKPAEINR
ncbi:hypothetical protein GF386_04805 [Candidatus Pacearchaeota archaeon]|nr:hypothetical protein [Candidatus Pacearchaeota archaeon]